MFRIESYITSIILSYVEKYVKNLRRQDAQVSLWDGEGLFQNLELDLDVLEKELNLPFIVISGHINQLLIRVPWTKLGSEAVKITIDTIECVLKLKTPQQRKAKKNDTSDRASTDYNELPPPSYVQSLINKIVGNLSVTCNNVILKYIEDDIVLSMNIKSITLDSCNSNWIPDIIELTPSQLTLRKIINLSDVTICLDRRNASGCIETYLEPLLYKCSLSMRLCRMFRSPHSARPYTTQMDIFCSKIAFILTEPQLPMFLRLLTLILELNPTDTPETNTCIDDEIHNRSPSSCSSISESNITNNDGWVDWMWNWVPSVSLTSEVNDLSLSPETAISGGHTLNTGIYIDTLLFVLKIKSNKKLNDYRPLLQIAFNGTLLEMVSNPPDWINVQFGISKASIDSIGDCTCGAQDCYTNNYFSSGVIQDSYLSKSLFQDNNINAFNDNIFSFDDHLTTFSETILLEKTTAFAIDYLFTQIPNTHQNNFNDDNENVYFVSEEKCLLRFVAGPSTLNISSGLVHRAEFIYKLILGHDLLVFTAPLQPPRLDTDEKFNALINSYVQVMVYQFTIFNPTIKVFPACHVRISTSTQKHKKNQKICSKHIDPVFENPPVAIFELKVLDGRIVTPKKKFKWAILPRVIVQNISEEKKAQLKTRTIFRVKDLIANLVLSESIQKLLVINNIGFNTTIDIDSNSDCILDIDMISFSTSKENCLLMYYIIHSIIMSNHRRLLQVNNFIFKSSLLDDTPGTVVLKFNFEGVKVYYKSENQVTCTKIILNNINAKMATNSSINDNNTSAIIFSTPEFIKHSVPFLHVIIQFPSEVDVNETPLIYLKIGQLDMNLDPMLFEWLVYVPKVNKQKEIKKKTSTSDLAFFSAPSRKISETSISSDPKKKYPKPSIHSSVSDNISFHSANYMHLKNETKENKIVRLFNKWKSSMVFVDTSRIALYFPSKSLSMLKKSQSCKNLDLKELIELSSINEDGLLVLRISNISLKCVVPQNQMEQYLNTTPVRFPYTLWSPDGVYFPWQLNFCKLECYTIHSTYDSTYQRSYTHKIQLLYPFSAQCTLAITTQFHNNNIQTLKSLAACIHCDSDPISICISEQQVLLVANLLKKQMEVYKVIFANIEYGTFFNRSVAHEMSSIPEDEPVESKTLQFDFKKTEETLKLSGWFQWTLARFSLIIKNNPKHSSSENVKLVLDLEDVISSLDFGLSYQKLKLKISSASIQHFTKNTKEEQWKHGPYLGLILKGYDPLNSSEKSSKTDGFLNFTLTRAIKSSFQGPKSNKDITPLHMVSDEMLKLNQQLMDEYIMEIVIKVQPIDIVISPLNLHQFLSIIDPLLDILINSKYILNPLSNSHNKLEPSNEFIGLTLPLFYLDIALLRIFIPISLQNKKNQHQDTAIIQVNSIKINQNPENPITRTPLRKDLYVEAEKRGLLTIPGSIVEDRQYQIVINGFSIKTGFWNDLKQVLECYQVLSTLDTDHQPNAALLWNEGKRPRAMGNSNLDEINTSTLFSKVSFHSVYAPAIIFEPENTLVCGSWMEVNTLNEISITLSVEQLNLFNILASQSNEYILSHLKTNYTHVIVQGEKVQSKFITESLTQDSGIHSTEDNSTCFYQENGSLIENKINNQSNIAIFIKKDTNIVNKVPIDIIITGNQINLNIFNCIKKNDIKVSEPLLFAVVHQPHVFFSLSSTSDSCQVIFFDLTISIAPKNESCIEIPDPKMYSVPLFKTKSNTMDEIPLAFFTLKMSRPITVSQYKVELNLGRAISLLLNKQKIDHCSNLLDLVKKMLHEGILPHEETNNYNFQTDSKFDKLEILSPSFKIDSVVSQYVTDEFDPRKYDNPVLDSTANTSVISEITNENVVDYPVSSVNEYCWYSKPIVMNLTTQQIFFQLSTENNNNIVLSIESILYKLNCLWRKPSERMNGEITLNSVTISVGHDYSNNNTNELILHPWTMTLEIILSSDPWVPEYLRPTKQLKILTDYISFHISPDHYNTLKLMWNEYKYLFEYNKNTTKKQNQSSESDEQFYQDDLRAGAFQFIETTNSDLPLPYQIFFSEHLLNNPPKITWRYPQPRTLTKIEIQPVPMDVDIDVKFHLQWYDEIQNCFRDHTIFIFPKYEPMLLRLESLEAVSNTWRIIMDNSCANHYPLQIKSLVGCLRVDSYFSPSLVPQLQLSLSASSIKINIAYHIKKKTYLSRYHCISDDPPKHKLVIFILDQVNIGFKLQEGEMNTSAQAHLRLELLNYGTLTQIPIVKSFCLFTSHHTTKPKPDIQYNIQTGAIACQFGPSMINSLMAAVQLWKNNTYFITTPYIICNDTNFEIIFGQASTNEVIILNSLQSYQYTWRVPTEHPHLRFSVGDADNLSWSNEISLRTEALMSLAVKNHKGVSHILIVSITNMSPSLIKVIVSSQLSVLNKTNYLLDARFTKIKQVEEQKDLNNLVLQTLSVSPENNSPSIMLYNGLKVTLKLSFHTPNHEGPWSGPIPLHAVELTNGNQNSWLVKIPMKDNIKKYRSIWCRLIIENINKIPRMLILLMPMYVVRSYLPYRTLLNFELVDNKLERNTIIEAKSAMALNDIQHIDLPGTMKDVYNLTIKLNEESSASSPPVSITYYMNIDIPELFNDSYFTIEDLLNGKYTIMDSDLQWPFVGQQYSSIKWKQCELPDTETTVKVQHYGHLDHSNGLSRVIVVQPWALIVNTSSQIITLCNATDVLCNIDNFCVVAPPVIENTFYIDLNIEDTTHRSQPLQLSNSQSFYMPSVNGLIPLKGHTSVVINCENHIGYLNVCSLEHNNMRVIHIQSLYVATNHSSIDLKVLAVCAIPSSGVLDIPENAEEISVDLPKNLNDLGKPLVMWTLIGKESANEDLEQYLILTSNGNISCPIKLTDIVKEERPLPVLFSSCDSNPLICVTLQELDNQYFFTIYNQPYPQFILYNYCPVSLTLALSKKSKSKSKSKEPMPFSNDWNWTYRISSGKNAYISFPYSVSCKQIPRVLIGVDKKPFKGWFASIELSVCESRLVPVPGQMNDIKVLITKRAFTLDVIFKPAAQFEFSANEVRLRLAKSDQFKGTLSSNNEVLNNVRLENVRTPTSALQNICSSSVNKLWPSIKCHIHTFILILFIDDIGFNSKAVASMTLDNIAATLDGNPDSSKEGEMNLVMSINNIQIDNNAFIDGHYDFPVILVKQKRNFEEVYCDTSFLKPLSNVINDLRQLDSAIIIKLTLDKSYYSTPVILDLEITLFTFEAFIEDRYCYYMLEILKSFKSTMSSTVEHNLVMDEFIPLHYLVLAHSQEFRNPLVFRTFTIKPFKVMISLHTSTTFYVALDRSPLDFTEFSKTDLIASYYQLGRSLSLHYFLNAIYGTGWALGSLEFWGSPGGLARSVGTGLYDFVTLSAQGMTEGPKEFFVGVLSGSASLVKHVTTGALSSVTKFASSWSRTFNRLTLEAEDLEQIEEIRRLRPQNLSQGIIQGLSEFGISLLGAVGGLVNHPIQYAIQEGPERRRGFVNTVAIGFVEAITKPISGAAELVAMTGEGFLAGVGWIKSPQLRSSLSNSEIGFGASELRYSWLILNKYLSTTEQVLLTCDATVDNLDQELKVSELTLVLTNRFLYLIKDPNCMMPNVLRLPITQIVTPSLRHRDPSLITITICMTAQNDTAYSRVADYVRKSQSFLNMESKTESDNPDQTHKLLVSPQIRNHILNSIEFLKRHIQNKGYAVI